MENYASELCTFLCRNAALSKCRGHADTEKQLNALLNDFFNGCDLEIEFETPTLELLLSAPKLYVDDGFRNAVENKGHGLQRASPSCGVMQNI